MLARIPQLPTFLFCLAGYAATIALSVSFEVHFFTEMHGPVCPFNKTVFAGGQVSIFVIVALLSRHRTLQPRQLFSGRIIALGAFGLLIISVGTHQTGMAQWLLTGVGSLIQGIQQALLKLVFLDFFARLEERSLLIYLSASHILPALLAFGLSMVAIPWIVVGALALLPAVAYHCYHEGLSRKGYPSDFHKPVSPSRWSFPYRPVVFIAVFFFVNEFVRSFLPSSTAIYTIFGALTTGTLVLLFALLAFDRLSLPGMYRISLPLLLGGILCFYPLHEVFFAALFTNAAYTLFSIFCTTLLCLISKRQGINPLWLLGITAAASDFAGLLGELPRDICRELLTTSSLTPLALTVIVPLLVYVFLSFLSSSDMQGSWGMWQQGIDEQKAESTAALLQSRHRDAYARVTRQFSLTRREEEVFVLLTKRKTVPEIENELFISSATAKTHVQHIYKKLGIHNRQELQDLFAQFMEE